MNYTGWKVRWDILAHPIVRFILTCVLEGPLAELWLNGPCVMGVGFWEGRPYADMCSYYLPGVPQTHWLSPENARDCETLINRKLNSFILSVDLVIYCSFLLWLFFMVACYLVVWMCRPSRGCAGWCQVHRSHHTRHTPATPSMVRTSSRHLSPESPSNGTISPSPSDNGLIPLSSSSSTQSLADEQ